MAATLASDFLRMFALEHVKLRPGKLFSSEVSSAYLEREQRVQADKHLLPATPSKTQTKTHTDSHCPVMQRSSVSYIHSCFSMLVAHTSADTCHTHTHQRRHTPVSHTCT